MTTQNQITLPAADFSPPNGIDFYEADTVRALLAAAVAKERENHDDNVRSHAAWVVKYNEAQKCIGDWIAQHAKLNRETAIGAVIFQNQIASLEAENAQLREQNTALDAKCAELESNMREMGEGLIEIQQIHGAQKAHLYAELAELRGKRVALSDEQITDIAFTTKVSTDDIETDWCGAITEFARAIERAHGIGEAK